MTHPSQEALKEADRITDAAAAEMRKRPGGGFSYDILHKHIALALDARSQKPAR